MRISGARFTWSSTSQAVAAVDQTGLVTGVGEGEVRITATSGGVSGSAGLTVLANFQPPGDTEVGGELRVNNFEIPAAVTVRVTRDLVVNAKGPVNVAGALVGDCVAVTVNGESTLTISGNVSNACTQLPDGEPPGLTLIGNGDLVFDTTSTIRSSGDVVVKNDPTLTDADFPEPGAARAPDPLFSATATSAQLRVELGGREEIIPRKAQSGKSGKIGGAGAPGRGFVHELSGCVVLRNLIIAAQSGGDGGPGMDESNTAAQAEGGAGGDGGEVRIKTTGFIIVDAPGGVFLEAGSGGKGGDATATGLLNRALEKGASAEAKGGKGGDAGLLQLLGGDISGYRGCRACEGVCWRWRFRNGHRRRGPRRGRRTLGSRWRGRNRHRRHGRKRRATP